MRTVSWLHFNRERPHGLTIKDVEDAIESAIGARIRHKLQRTMKTMMTE
jgi:hypothetical protein